MVAKAKPQPAAPLAFEKGMVVVKPGQGIGQIIDTVKTDIGGISFEAYNICYENGSTSTTPATNKGLRPLTTKEGFEAVFVALAGRARVITTGNHETKLKELKKKSQTGQVIDQAELIRDIYESRQPGTGIPSSRRELYELVLAQLIREVELVFELSRNDAKNLLDEKSGRPLSSMMPDIDGVVHPQMSLEELERRTKPSDPLRGSGKPTRHK